MKTFNVRLAETFLWDMIDITLFILPKIFIVKYYCPAGMTGLR